MSGQAPSTTRRDAVRNRERLLAAARQVFSERGHDVALEEVARVAGVSRTTLYRNFSTREELAATVFEDNVERIENRAEEVRDDADGLARLFDFVLDVGLANRGLTQVLAGADVRWFADLRERIAASFEPLLERGIASGVVRPDVDVDDLMVAVAMADRIAGTHDDSRREQLSARARRLLRRALLTA